MTGVVAPVPSPLSRIIAREIDRTGSISFARFMRLALYHPEFGFYRRRATPFGRYGHFFTAAQLQPVFGLAIARAVEQLQSPDLPDGVLELGAGGMELSSALSAFRYRAYDWGTQRLPRAFSGIVLAHEFFDALPVHLLRRAGAYWHEIRVFRDLNSFRFGSLPASSILARSAERHRKYLSDDILELCPDALSWVKRISRMLRAGYLLIIDYGHSNSELRRFPDGSLLSYRSHVATHEILLDPGERDITAHVNFSDLSRALTRVGFTLCSDSSLRKWLLSLWDEAEFESLWSEWPRRERLQWKQLAVGMGETFRVLLFSRFRSVPKQKALDFSRA